MPSDRAGLSPTDQDRIFGVRQPELNICFRTASGSTLRLTQLDNCVVLVANGADRVYSPQWATHSSTCADGTGVEHLNCAEPHCTIWSPAPLNKSVHLERTGYDICLLDVTTRVVSKLTDGIGSNEQPSFAPNGRHVVFTTTRWGKLQLAMVDLKGTVLKRRITEIGNNKFPTWSGAAQ